MEKHVRRSPLLLTPQSFFDITILGHPCRLCVRPSRSLEAINGRRGAAEHKKNTVCRVPRSHGHGISG